MQIIYKLYNNMYYYIHYTCTLKNHKQKLEKDELNENRKVAFFNHTPVLPSQPLIPEWTDFAFWKNCNLFATENSSKCA